MNRTKIVCLAFLAVLLPAKAAMEEGSVPEPRETMPLRDTQWAELEPQLARLDPEMFYSCGRNALYVFLRLSGNTKVSFDEVKAAVPLTAPYGTTMKSLRDAAQKLHCDAQVRLYNSNDFDSVPLPAIVHLSSIPIGANAHFDVMYNRDSEWIYLINGTTGEQHKVRRRRFATKDWWTGWALTEKPSSLDFVADQWLILATGFVITDIALAGMWLRRSRRSKAPA